MQILVYVLLLFDLHGPEALDSFLGLAVRVAFVGVGFRDAQGKEGEREELEGFAGGLWGGGGGREEGVFLCGRGVGGGLEGAEGAFDYEMVGALERCYGMFERVGT